MINGLNKIRGFRVMAGLTQEELAKEIGITRNCFILKEKNPDKFTTKQISLICEVLNRHGLSISIIDLL